MTLPIEHSYKHLFGPIQSRRLGVSLGVDPIVFKTCTLDCVYCECGATTNLTDRRCEYVAFQEIIDELRDCLEKQPILDFVTFGGSGEPTLYSRLDDVCSFIKTQYPTYKTALLTNGTLFIDPDVRSASCLFDRVLPSLDAISQDVFETINRPVKHMDNKRVIEGLIAFSHEYTKELWVEVFVIPGVNDSESELARFKEVLTQMRLSRVQLNSLDRPGTCADVKPASAERLGEIANFLLPLPVEIISRNQMVYKAIALQDDLIKILCSTLARRPMMLEELAILTGRHINETREILAELISQKRIAVSQVGPFTFYQIPT